jgi:hypothetical protein
MLVLVLALALMCCSPTLALLCYNPAPPSDVDVVNGITSVILANLPFDNAVCLRYTYMCTKTDKACKPADAGKWQWGYVTSVMNTCTAMKKSPTVYKNVLCCTTDRCNAPEPKQDKTTRVLPGELKVGKAPGPWPRPL